MSVGAICRVGSLKDIASFQKHLQDLNLHIPCDPEIVTGSQSPLRWELKRGPFKIGNRIAVQPMEGWDATPDGAPSDLNVRRWQRFGSSGGKPIWGGEAVATCDRVRIGTHVRDERRDLRLGDNPALDRHSGDQRNETFIPRPDSGTGTTCSSGCTAARLPHLYRK